MYSQEINPILAKTLPRLQAKVDQTLFVIFDDTDEVGNLELDIFEESPQLMNTFVISDDTIYSLTKTALSSISN